MLKCKSRTMLHDLWDSAGENPLTDFQANHSRIYTFCEHDKLTIVNNTVYDCIYIVIALNSVYKTLIAAILYYVYKAFKFILYSIETLKTASV